MNLLQTLIAQYPNGHIPMDVFVANESALRVIMRREKLRVWFRGPRPQYAQNGSPSATRRENARAVAVYHK